MVYEIQNRFKKNDSNLFEAMIEVIVSEEPDINSIKFNQVKIKFTMLNRMFKCDYKEYISNKIEYFISDDLEVGFITKIVKLFLNISINTAFYVRSFSCLSV